MNQPSLDFTIRHPRTHSDDPGSSHAAEAQSRPSWTAKHRCLVAMLTREPGLTAPEISERLPSDSPFPCDWRKHQEVRRRLSDLGPKGAKRLRIVHTRGDRHGRWFVA